MLIMVTNKLVSLVFSAQASAILYVIDGMHIGHVRTGPSGLEHTGDAARSLVTGDIFGKKKSVHEKCLVSSRFRVSFVAFSLDVI